MHDIVCSVISAMTLGACYVPTLPPEFDPLGSDLRKHNNM
jgi:hypothetical protein